MGLLGLESKTWGASCCATLGEVPFICDCQVSFTSDVVGSSAFSIIVGSTGAGGLPKGGGGGHSGVAHFFLFLLLAGIATISVGVWWSQV